MDCLTCHKLSTDHWPPLPTSWYSSDKSAYPIYANVLQAALGGCNVCATLVEGIRKVIGEVLDTTRILFDIRNWGSLSVILFAGDNNTSHDSLEFYALEGTRPSYKPGSAWDWQVFGGSQHVAHDLDLNTALIRISQWVSHCDTYHEGCHTHLHTSFLPNRILNINPRVSEHSIFLEETDGRKNGRYMTLSYCWGTLQPITTTTTTLSMRKAGISVSELPPTFFDAVQLTRRLGIDYLWIDSLCILQDDISDWEKESALMCTIYTDSYLNIAATHSRDSGGGLFSRRWIPSNSRFISKPPFPLELKTYAITSGLPSNEIGIFVRRSLELAHEEISESGNGNMGVGYGWRPYTDTAPLLSRGWAFQERVLSFRSIHFHASELFWDCKSELQCECGGMDRKYRTSAPFRPALFERSNDPLDEQWQATARKYSALSLTVSLDKLPALSGIAARFSEWVGSVYLAGLWRDHLPQQLLWVADWSPLGGPPTETQFVTIRAQPYRAPTWSWASVDLTNTNGNYGCPVRWVWNKDPIDSRFEVISAECVVAGDNPFGRVSSGALVVISAFLSVDREMTEVQMHSRSYKLWLKGHSTGAPGSSGLLKEVFFADTPSLASFKQGLQATQPRPVLKVLIMTSRVGMVVKLLDFEAGGGPQAEASTEAQAIVDRVSEAKIIEKEEYYERVGLVLMGKSRNLFSHAEQGIFHII